MRACRSSLEGHRERQEGGDATSERVGYELINLFFGHHFHFPAQLVGGVTLSDLSGLAVVIDVSPPPRCVPSFLVELRVQHSHCSSIFLECS